MRSHLGHVVGQRFSLSLLLFRCWLLCGIQKPMASKWPLYKPNKLLYCMYLQTTTYLKKKNCLPTNKSVISRLLWAAGYVGHCPCEVHLSCEHLLLRSNGGLKSITERSTTLTFKARITVPDCISYLKLLPWYIRQRAGQQLFY